MNRVSALAAAVVCLCGVATPTFAASVLYTATGQFASGGGTSSAGDATWLSEGDYFSFSFIADSSSGVSGAQGTTYALVGTPTVTATDSFDSSKTVLLPVSSSNVNADYLRLYDRLGTQSVRAQTQTSDVSGVLRLGGNLGTLLSGEAVTGTPPYLPGTLGIDGVNDFTLIWKNQFEYFSLVGPVTSLTASPVPLPAAVWLLLSGIGGIGAVMRKRFGPVSRPVFNTDQVSSD